MKDQIKVIIKRPYEPLGRTRAIPNTLECLQDLVGGYIETIHIAPGLLLICNEEGKLHQLPINFSTPHDIFCGTVVICGEDGEEFDDVPIPLRIWESYLRIWKGGDDI